MNYGACNEKRLEIENERTRSPLQPRRQTRKPLNKNEKTKTQGKLRFAAEDKSKKKKPPSWREASEKKGKKAQKKLEGAAKLSPHVE